jgi:hypothetical protein
VSRITGYVLYSQFDHLHNFLVKEAAVPFTSANEMKALNVELLEKGFGNISTSIDVRSADKPATFKKLIAWATALIAGSTYLPDTFITELTVFRASIDVSASENGMKAAEAQQLITETAKKSDYAGFFNTVVTSGGWPTMLAISRAEVEAKQKLTVSSSRYGKILGFFKTYESTGELSKAESDGLTKDLVSFVKHVVSQPTDVLLKQLYTISRETGDGLV